MPNTPVRIQRKRAKGWKAPLDENGLPPVSISRPSIFGNPYAVAEFGHDAAVKFFRRWMDGESTFDVEGATPEARQKIIDNIHLLKHRNVMCWCRRSDSCHGDWYLERLGAGDTR